MEIIRHPKATALLFFGVVIIGLGVQAHEEVAANTADEGSTVKCLQLDEKLHNGRVGKNHHAHPEVQRELDTIITIIDVDDNATTTTSDSDAEAIRPPSNHNNNDHKPSFGTNFQFEVPYNFSHIFFLGGACGDTTSEDEWYNQFIAAGMGTIEGAEVVCPPNEDGNIWWTRAYCLEALDMAVEMAGDKLNETLVITVGVGLETDWTPVADLLRKGMAFFHAKEDPIEVLDFNLTEHGLIPEDILYLYFQWDEESAAERNGIELCRLKGGSKILKIAKLYFGGRDSAPLDYRIDIAFEAFKHACPDVEVIEVWSMYHNVSDDNIKATLLFNPLPDVVLTARDLHAQLILRIASEVLTPEEYSQISTTGWNNIFVDLLNERKILMTVDQLVLYPKQGIWRAIETVVNIVQSAGLNSTKAIQKGMDRGDSVTIYADTLTISGDRAGYLTSTLLSGYDAGTPPYEINPVSTGLLGVTITKMDPFEGKFQAVLWVQASWHDPRLRWNPILNDAEVPIDADLIWTPKLYFRNEFMHEDLYLAPAMLAYDGTVILETNILAEFLCPTTEELRKFPFDTYNCAMELGAPNGVVMNQNYGFQIVQSDPHYTTTNSTSLDHDEHDPDEIPEDHYSTIVYYQLVFVRRPFTTYMRLILPAILINLIGFMAFWIPELPESVALGITSLLCSLAFRETVEMPDTADITWTEIFMMVNISYLASVMFITWVSYSSSTRLGAYLNGFCQPLHPKNIMRKTMASASVLMSPADEQMMALERKKWEMEYDMECAEREGDKARKPTKKEKAYLRSTTTATTTTNGNNGNGISNNNSFSSLPKKDKNGLSHSIHPELAYNDINGDGGAFWDSYHSLSQPKTSQHWSSKHVPLQESFREEEDDGIDLASFADEAALPEQKSVRAAEQKPAHVGEFEKKRTGAEKGMDLESIIFDNTIDRVTRKRVNVDWIGRWFIVPSYIIVILTLLFGGWGFKN